jgi:hypothetical protein
MLYWLVLVLAAAQPAAADPPASPEAQALIANCNAHKFETTVMVTGPDGKPKQSQVKICGQAGQSDTDWVKTLRDAVDKVSANPGMSPSVKQQITGALQDEIGRLTGQVANITPGPVPNLAPPAVAAPAARPPEYATLPPIPTARPPEYAALPPMPTAPTVATPRLLGTPAMPVVRPRLTIRCFNPNDMLGEVACNELVRDMQLAIRADENLPPGISLRFLRRGEDRGQLELAAMRKGRSVRLAIPPGVCRGVSGSRVEIQVLSRGAVAESLGPYDLRC